MIWERDKISYITYFSGSQLVSHLPVPLSILLKFKNLRHDNNLHYPIVIHKSWERERSIQFYRSPNSLMTNQGKKEIKIPQTTKKIKSCQEIQKKREKIKHTFSSFEGRKGLIPRDHVQDCMNFFPPIKKANYLKNYFSNLQKPSRKLHHLYLHPPLSLSLSLGCIHM